MEKVTNFSSKVERYISVKAREYEAFFKREDGFELSAGLAEKDSLKEGRDKHLKAAGECGFSY